MTAQQIVDAYSELAEPDRPHIRQRANLTNIHAVLVEGMRTGLWQPGSLICTKTLAQAIGQNAAKWYKDEYRQSGFSLTSKLSYLLGRHGLKLQRFKAKSGTYICPTILPVVENDKLYSEAEY